MYLLIDENGKKWLQETINGFKDDLTTNDLEDSGIMDVIEIVLPTEKTPLIIFDHIDETSVDFDEEKAEIMYDKAYNQEDDDEYDEDVEGEDKIYLTPDPNNELN